MAAVACDIVEMVQHLELPRQPRPILNCLQEVFFERSLRSIPDYRRMAAADWDLASGGFFLDLFRIAIARPPNGEGWDKKRQVMKETSISHWMMLERTRYPGGDVLRLGRLPVHQTVLQGLYGSLENMKASFICSGPFKLALTTYPSEHLTLSNNGKIRLFWEGRSQVSALPGAKSFLRYKKHTLGGFAAYQFVF
jgi:hypothetical protein